MKRPAIFFDRDNTLIACDGFLDDPSKLVLVDGAADAVARSRALGYAVVIVSNQSGVARGMFDEQTVHDVNNRMQQLLLSENLQAVIDRQEFCPHHPDGTVEAYRQDSPRRKPAPGMLLDAAEALALDLPNSWMIGDTARDILAGQAAGCRTILITHAGLAESPATADNDSTNPDARVSSLADALNVIERAPAITPPAPVADDEATADESSEPVAESSAPSFESTSDYPVTSDTASESTDEIAPTTEVTTADTSDASVATDEAITTDNSAPADEPPAPVEPAIAAPQPSRPKPRVQFTTYQPPAATYTPPHRDAPTPASPPAGATAARAASANATPSPAQPKQDNASQVVPPPAPLEYLTREILQELRRNRENNHVDFSVGKLLAGIIQVLVLGVLFFAYINRKDIAATTNLLLLAIVFQVAALTLMLMGRNK